MSHVVYRLQYSFSNRDLIFAGHLSMSFFFAKKVPTLGTLQFVSVALHFELWWLMGGCWPTNASLRVNWTSFEVPVYGIFTFWNPAVWRTGGKEFVAKSFPPNSFVYVFRKCFQRYKIAKNEEDLQLQNSETGIVWSMGNQGRVEIPKIKLAWLQVSSLAFIFHEFHLAYSI